MMHRSVLKIDISASLNPAKLPQDSVAKPVWITPETVESTSFRECFIAFAALWRSHVSWTINLSGRRFWKAFSALAFAPCLSTTGIRILVGKCCSNRSSSGTMLSDLWSALNWVSPEVVSRTKRCAGTSKVIRWNFLVNSSLTRKPQQKIEIFDLKKASSKNNHHCWVANVNLLSDWIC